MKRLTLILTILVAVFAFSCEEEPTMEINHSAVVTQGEWKVLLFFDETGDKGKTFSKYTFKFVSGGQVLAKSNNGDDNGSWLIGEVDETRNKMTLSFDQAPLSDMKRDWFIRDIDENKIELILVDNANSQNLVFARVR